MTGFIDCFKNIVSRKRRNNLDEKYGIKITYFGVDEEYE